MQPVESIFMDIMRHHFKPSLTEIGEQLSEQISDRLARNNTAKTIKVEAQYEQWIITFDIFTEIIGDLKQTFTRMRAPYVNKDDFRFAIYRTGFFSMLGKLFGMQDIETGEPEFDDAFIIKGNDELTVQKLFSNWAIRRLIELQPKLYLAVWDDDREWFKSGFPTGVNQLYFRVPGMITDIQRLQSLYELFAEVLSQLCRIGSADQDAPGITL